MTIFQFIGILLMLSAVVMAIGWIGWGLTNDKLEEERKVTKLQSEIIDNLTAENIALEKTIIFLKAERIKGEVDRDYEDCDKNV